jgi:hypothetical protein
MPNKAVRQTERLAFVLSESRNSYCAPMKLFRRLENAIAADNPNHRQKVGLALQLKTLHICMATCRYELLS